MPGAHALIALHPPRRPRPAPPARAAARRALPRVCFVGLENLPVLSRAYEQHGIGGEQVQHTLLARALARRGWDVSMVVADYGQADGARLDGITLHKAHPLQGGMPVLRFVHPRLTGLWSALRRADAQVYYLSCASMQLGVAAAFARLHGRRLVFRLASDADCEPDRLLIRHARDRWLYEWGLRRADVVLAQSEHQAQRLKANYGLDSRLAAMLVDPAQRVRPFDERDIDVLWVSNLRPLKRPELALELARRLPGLRVHLVGGPLPGHEDLYAQVQAQAQALPQVRFHGRVPYHGVNALYERARVFVNTSEVEGFPNAYLQAWRRGTPSVAFFDPDAIVRTHGLGRSAGDLDELVEGARLLATDAQAWAGAHARCLRFMDERYGEDQVLGPYIEALQAQAGGVRA